jgi:riboflavin synthase
MFTGIIGHTGKFREYGLGKKLISIEAPSIQEKLELGESLSVNGVCLSLIKKEKGALFFNLAEETLRLSNLSRLHRGDRLNLELPLTLATPLSGHLVTGHVDAVGKILKIAASRKGKRITLSYPDVVRPYLVHKGSVALNGVSLTIAALTSTSFDVEVIPITLDNTNLGHLPKGALVNIESDLIGKYVYNWWLMERHRQ